MKKAHCSLPKATSYGNCLLFFPVSRMKTSLMIKFWPTAKIWVRLAKNNSPREGEPTQDFFSNIGDGYAVGFFWAHPQQFARESAHLIVSLRCVAH